MENRETYTANGNILHPTFQRVGWKDRVQANSQADVERCRTGRRFVGAGDTPATSLSWRTRSQKAKALDDWRVEVGKMFSESPRVLRIAWALEAMLGTTKPYARVTDSYLSRKLGIPRNKIEAAMAKLERSGVIVRASIVVDGKTHRRIWPARADARPATGDCPAVR